MLRDNKGNVNFLATLSEANLSDPLEVELMAIFWALQFCAPLRILIFMVKTNCLVLVQALEDGADLVAAYSHLISEILSIKNCFGSYNFNCNSRLGNQAAHFLACYAWQVNATTIWSTSCPNFSLLASWIESNLYIQVVI